MKFISKTTLPVTQYRKAPADMYKYLLDNGMNVEIADTEHGISTVFQSTHVCDHETVEAGVKFLKALNDLDVYEGTRIDFRKVRAFALSYRS